MGDSDVQPFAAYAGEYLDQGWHPLPLPVKKKRFPPTGFTGRAGSFADDKQLQKWLRDMTFEVKRDDGTTYDCAIGNIAIRVGNKILGTDGKLYEVIGIDVDDYGEKHGWDELKRLEEQLGTLPDTWTSSARDDRRSGIRFFLVPIGLAFKGKPDESVTAIEIVQRVHRYAVVWPSWNPNAKAEYRWYAPGDVPDGANYTRRVPHVNELAYLPDTWVEHLTAGYTRDSEGKYGIDLDSTRSEVMEWVRTNFNGTLIDSEDGMCRRMRKVVSLHIQKILDSDSSHDVLTTAHWNILNECVEGHSGYKEAIQAIETVWLEEVGRQNKRTISEIKGEFKRSVDGTLRKIKAHADAMAAQGVSIFMPEVCEDLSDIAGVGDIPEDADPWAEDVVDRWIDSVPIDLDVDPKDYGKSEIEQARQFLDRIGEQTARFVWDYNEWIIYDKGRWVLDTHHQIKRLFWRAICEPYRRKAIECNKKADSMVENGKSASDAEVRKLKDQAADYNRLAEAYGNNAKIESTLKLVQAHPGIGIRYNELNCERRALAMPNGKVLFLEAGQPDPKSVGYTITDNDRSFYTTKTTRVDLLAPIDIPPEEKRKWMDYLDLFLPPDIVVNEAGEEVKDYSYRQFVRRALGHVLLGGNPQKLAVFLVGQPHTGKSTMIHCIQHALGSYAMTFRPSSVFRERESANVPELLDYAQCRVITASEAGGMGINANIFKNATGGDNISGTRKHSNHTVDVSPQFTMLIATNGAPRIEQADPATVDRILVLPFNHAVNEKTNDPDADQRLPFEVPHAVLAWLAAGYRDYMRVGLAKSTWHHRSVERTRLFTNEFNEIGSFILDYCEVADQETLNRLVSKSVLTEARDMEQRRWETVPIQKIWELYKKDFEGGKLVGQRQLNRRVEQLFGVKVERCKRGDLRDVRVFQGLRWKGELSRVVGSDDENGSGDGPKLDQKRPTHLPRSGA